MADAIPNSFLEKMLQKKVASTLSVKLIRTNEIAMMAKTAGFDGLMIDMEHSTLDLDVTGQLCIAALTAGIAPIVRSPSKDTSLISRIMDGGALGIIVPHVQTVEEVKGIVNAAKFRPVGKRSVTGPLPHYRFQSVVPQVTTQACNDATMVIPMIETLEALEAVEEIAALPGVDGLFLGSNDLTAEMGIYGEYDNEQFTRACEKILAAGQKHGVFVGVGGLQSRFDLVEKLCGMGASWVSAGVDANLFLSAAAQKAKEVQDLGDRVRV